MPRPKNPNTAAATEVVRRRGQETMAEKLRDAGWTVTPPDATARTRKPGLSRRQHVELGAQLQAARDTLVEASVLLANNYPRASKAVTLAGRVSRLVDELRSELDDMSARELLEDDWSPLIYYAANTEQRNQWLEERPLDGEKPRNRRPSPPGPGG